MPFQTKNKTRLLFVMTTFPGTGFAIPFLAVRFQEYKSFKDFNARILVSTDLFG